jgi:hypothetical protein
MTYNWLLLLPDPMFSFFKFGSVANLFPFCFFINALALTYKRCVTMYPFWLKHYGKPSLQKFNRFPVMFLRFQRDKTALTQK